MRRTIVILTSDLNIMSAIGGMHVDPTVVLRCVPTIPQLTALVEECIDDDLCVIVSDEHTDVRSFVQSISPRSVAMIGLVDHPYPDIVQHLRLQGIQHVIKRDALSDLLTSLTRIPS